MSTYEPIATQTLGSATASVTFSSIPQGYTDLVLVCNIAQSSGNNSLRYRFNGDAGSNYSDSYLYGNGTSASSGRDTSQTSGTIYVTGSTTIETNYIVQFMNYSNATTYKTVLGRSNRANSEVAMDVGLWRNTSAINSISLAMGGSFPTNNFASGSTFSIYGIQVGDKAQKAQGGNIVTSDGTYVYHTFTSSGSFIPSEALTVDYLVVAGGGGGGTLSNGGGGGAGGLRSTVTATGGGGSLESPLSLTAKAYPVFVGAGGASNTSGGNSTFGTITSTGGGYGEKSGGFTLGAGNGGSGGGTGYFSTAKGLGTSGQGFDGGISNSLSGAYGSGGGGGAGAVGQDGTNTKGGNGGNGVAVSISGSSVTYAGGGGGSGDSGAQPTGGTGGGGNGSPGTATNGAPNTGGGSGADRNSTGVNGGSGIVIIRYLA